MAEFTTLVRASPAGGYRWKVIADGQPLREGTCPDRTRSTLGSR